MGEIRSLTGMRGIAALIVFLDHTRANLDGRGMNIPIPDILQRVFLSGGRQVDIFFVLSGFILSLIYSERFLSQVNVRSYFDFLWRRFARIYPLHFFMLLLILAFVFAAKLAGAVVVNGLDRFDFSTLPQHFLLVHAWGIMMNGPPLWNPPSWSISIEALAYLLFPIIVVSTWGTFKLKPLPIFVITALLGFGLNAIVPWGISGVDGIVRGLTEFALGVVTARFFNSHAATWLQSSLGSTVAVAAFLVVFAIVPDTGFIIAFVASPLLLTLCANNIPSRILGSGPIYFLGEISYSIYLGHFLFSSVAYRIISTEWMKQGMFQEVIGVSFVIAFVIGLSTGTYYLVERPGRDFLNSYLKQRRGHALT
jgi:peptidoglycan/LPS O-acetylase OafA/YrhL